VGQAEGLIGRPVGIDEAPRLATVTTADHGIGGPRKLTPWSGLRVIVPVIALMSVGVFVPAGISSAAESGSSTPFTPSVPNPTTATAAQLQAAAHKGGLSPQVTGSVYGPYIAPATILARAQSWVNESVPYSQTNYWTDGNGTYRQDCSGFISMALDLATGGANNYGLTTQTLPEVATVLGSTEQASLNALQPGDFVDETAQHVVLFASWVTPGSIANVYQEPSPGDVAQYTTISMSYFMANDYWGFQYNNMVGATAPSSLMNVFFRTSSGQMGADWWSPTGGWVSQVLPGPANVASAPTAILNSTSLMNVFYQTTGGQVGVDWWTPTGGWINQILPGPADVASAPKAIVNSPSLMNVFFQTTGGQMGADWWTPAGGWISQTLPGPANVSSAPAPIANSPSLMNVFFQASSGQMGADWWTPAGGWISQTLPGPASFSGQPAALAASPSLMYVHARTSGGQMVSDSWTPFGGWRSQTLPGPSDVAGAPTGILNTPSLLNVFFQTTTAQIGADWWTPSGGWISQTLPGPASVGNAPAAIVNSPSLMNVFFQTTSGQMGADWWSPAGGWISQILPGPANVSGQPAAIANAPYG
jgi:hypothetical protein